MHFYCFLKKIMLKARKVLSPRQEVLLLVTVNSQQCCDVNSGILASAVCRYLSIQSIEQVAIVLSQGAKIMLTVYGGVLGWGRVIRGKYGQKNPIKIGLGS